MQPPRRRPAQSSKIPFKAALPLLPTWVSFGGAVEPNGLHALADGKRAGSKTRPVDGLQEPGVKEIRLSSEEEVKPGGGGGGEKQQ